MFQQLITSQTLENQLSEESQIRLNLKCRGVGRCRGGDQGDRDHPQQSSVTYLAIPEDM